MRVRGVILTKDEELHIARCIRSLRPFVDDILVVDSGSSDRTQEIARDLGAIVVEHAFIHHAAQLNAAIDLCGDFEGWLLRLDADEILQPDGVAGFRSMLAAAEGTKRGILLRRKIHFMGRRLRWGAVDAIWSLRLWRHPYGRCELRWMDEHVRVRGEIGRSSLEIHDINLNSLHWWTEKHNGYASREAIEMLVARQRTDAEGWRIPKRAQAKRWIKNNLYALIPPPARGALYFFYRYFLRLGFLDGSAGLYFHLLQGLWYRTLVEAKSAEIEQFSRLHGVQLTDAIRIKTGLDVRKAPPAPQEVRSPTMLRNPPSVREAQPQQIDRA